MDTARQNKVVHVSQLLPEQLSQPVPFEIVDLTPEERELALKEAMVKKHKQLEQDRKKRIAELKANDLRRPWSPNELYNYARIRATQIIRNESGDQTAVFEPQEFQKPVIKALCLYFTNNPLFEELSPAEFNPDSIPLSLNKGIWLFSDPGQGKTLLMTMFSRNKRQNYQVVQCPKIVAGYTQHGEQHIEKYSRIVSEDPQEFNFFQQTAGFCYNDLGTEPLRAKNYGNDINVMETIMLDTYERKVPFSHRHVTTNLTFGQIKEAYGARVIDRINQSFNILELRGTSLRR